MAPEKMDFQVIATSLMGAVGDAFMTMGKIKMSKDPTITSKPIVVEDNHMKVSGYAKFAVKSYISYIYYYSSESDKNADRPCGAIIIYVKESGVIKLLDVLGYLKSGDTEDQLIKDMVGEFCNVIAGGLKQQVINLGGPNMQISVPFGFKDVVPGGIKFPRNLKTHHELKVYLWESNPVVVDLVLNA